MGQGSRARMYRSPAMACLAAALLVMQASQAEAAVCWRSFTVTAYPNCTLLAPSYALHWSISNTTISYGVEVDGSVDWVGLGISNGGGMSGADITIVMTTDGGQTWTAGDYFAAQQGHPTLDTALPGGTEDATLGSVVRTANYTAAAFSRPIESCDAWDWPVIHDVDQTMIWAHGVGLLAYHGVANRGSFSLRLQPLPSALQPADPSDLFTLEMILPSPFTIPADQVTTYMCTIIDLPQDAKYQAIRYDTVINNSLVHHQVLYTCSQPPIHPVGVIFDCFAEYETYCAAFYMVSAPGVTTIEMPPAAALPFGKGSVVWAMLQIHYNNPNGVANQTDQSGFAVHLTRQLRPNDMGVLTVGSEQLDLFPGNASLAVENVCPGLCTDHLAAPLNIYTSFLHMHHLGKSMSTRLIRNGSELPAIGYKNYYNYDFQGVTDAPLTSRTLYPGDVLITTCTYDTLGQANVTYFGPASTNEMCYNFIMYWPAVPTTMEMCITYDMGDYAATPLAACTNFAALNNPNATLASLELGNEYVVSSDSVPYTPYVSSCGLSATRQRVSAPPAAAAPPPAAVNKCSFYNGTSASPGHPTTVQHSSAGYCACSAACAAQSECNLFKFCGASMSKAACWNTARIVPQKDGVCTESSRAGR